MNIFRIFRRKKESGNCEFDNACDCSSNDKPNTCEKCQFYFWVDSGNGWCRAMPKFEAVAWCRDVCSLYKEQGGEMTKPTTVEELRGDIETIVKYHTGFLLADKSTDDIIQAIFRWCKKHNIKQVVEGELPGFENSRVGKDCFNRLWAFRKDMFKWHKQSLKPVSSLLKGADNERDKV